MKGGDHLQGAPDLLGLKTLEKGASHGFGITLHAEEFRKSYCEWGKGLCILPCTGGSANS